MTTQHTRFLSSLEYSRTQILRAFSLCTKGHQYIVCISSNFLFPSLRVMSIPWLANRNLSKLNKAQVAPTPGHTFIEVGSFAIDGKINRLESTWRLFLTISEHDAES